MRKFTDLYLGQFKVITAQISLKLLFRNSTNLFHARFVGYVLDFHQLTIGNHWLPIIAYLTYGHGDDYVVLALRQPKLQTVFLHLFWFQLRRDA